MKINEGFDWSFREWTVKSIEEVIRNEFSHMEGYATADNIIYLQAFNFSRNVGFSNDSGVSIRFAKNGEAYMRLDFTSTNRYFRINACTLSDVYYPLYIIPIYTMKIGNNIIDTSILGNYGTVPAPLMFKKETITFRDRGGYILTRDFMIVYCDITNMPTSSINYDLSSLGVIEIKLNGIRQKFIIDREIQFECSGGNLYPDNVLNYYTSLPYQQGTIVTYYKLNEFFEGDTTVRGKIVYKQETISNKLYYVPNIWRESIEVSGSNSVRISDNYGEGACFFFSLNETTFTGKLKRYNDTDKTEDFPPSILANNYIIPSANSYEPITTPSSWIYASQYYIPSSPSGYLLTIFPFIACPLFTIDTSVNNTMNSIEIISTGSNNSILGAGFGSNITTIQNNFDEVTVPDPNWINTH